MDYLWIILDRFSEPSASLAAPDFQKTLRERYCTGS